MSPAALPPPDRIAKIFDNVVYHGNHSSMLKAPSSSERA
jgi:hypothetical protein